MRCFRGLIPTGAGVGVWCRLIVVAGTVFGVAERGDSEQPDHAGDGQDAFAKLQVHPLAGAFKACDSDRDGMLTEAEYLKRGGREPQQLRREFKVFDSDGDGRMSLSEFVAVPVGQPDEQRGEVADPIVLLANKALKELTAHWDEWDGDGDGVLNITEFESAKVGELVRGLKATKLADWDLDRDQNVSREELAKVLEIAFGVRTPDGQLLREKTGRVIDWRLFRRLKPDRDGFVSVQEYAPALGPLPEADKKTWIDTTDRDHDGKFDYAEFARSNHRTDPVGTFLNLDTDLNGRLTPKELKTLTPDQVPIAACMFPGFDDDRDGGLSLREYQLTPLVNFLANWESAQDTDEDGQLQLEEFRFHPGIALRALSAEYFRRLDVNGDQSLSLDEFPFITTRPPPNEIRVRFADGRVLSIAIPEYPNIFSPEISPDGKWIAVDGWKHRQSSGAARLLIASVETDEVRNLGIGCIPHWSADSRRICYSKYGQGVFIRDLEGDGEEELIDPQGWAIEFSPDGKQTAYVIGNNNFIIHDVATNERRPVFPEGQSPYRYIEHNFTWSPDSKRLCFKGHRPNGGQDVGIVNATGGDPQFRVRCDAKDVSSDFSWLPDGKRVMFGRRPEGATRTQIFEIDPDGDQPAVRYPKQPDDRNNICVCWSRDGKTFVYLSTK